MVNYLFLAKQQARLNSLKSPKKCLMAENDTRLAWAAKEVYAIWFGKEVAKASKAETGEPNFSKTEAKYSSLSWLNLFLSTWLLILAKNLPMNSIRASGSSVKKVR